MTKSTGVGTGNGKRYDGVVKSVPAGFYLRQETGSHRCVSLHRENSSRIANGESPVYIFKDIESKTWSMRVGLEFIRMNNCPYCGEKL